MFLHKPAISQAVYFSPAKLIIANVIHPSSFYKANCVTSWILAVTSLQRMSWFDRGCVIWGTQAVNCPGQRRFRQQSFGPAGPHQKVQHRIFNQGLSTKRTPADKSTALWDGHQQTSLRCTHGYWANMGNIGSKRD